MAASDARPFPIKNVAYRAYFNILDADGDPVTGATALDSEISKDGGTFADCTNEATEIATASGMYYLDLTSTEMNADGVCIQVKTSSSGAKTTQLVIYPLSIPEPAGVVSYPTDILSALGFLVADSRNKATQTDTIQQTRNDADSGTLWSRTMSDDGTTFTRGEAT